MQWELEAKQGFNPNAINGFISDFKATIAFANLTENGIFVQGGYGDSSPPQDTGGKGDADLDRPCARAPTDTATKDRDERAETRVEDYTIPLRGGGTAVLTLSVPLSPSNYKALEGWVHWTKDSLVADGDDGGENGGS